MPLMTKDDYLSTLKNLKSRIFIQGKPLSNVLDNPISRPPAMAMAETYYQAEQEEMKPLFTARSHFTGEIINRFTHIQRSNDDLVKKIYMLREMGRRTACCLRREIAGGFVCS
jgi:4-hydroxybutyryl-CoA dehydratase/vinylacetyl-CoA-Delta-isomerase